MLNILVAYPYIKPDVIKVLYENQDKIRFLLDSGAFTAWKAGKPISLDEYCKFIEQLPFKPWRYFTLDVVGNPEKSFENYQIMLKRGFNPIPIFTRGEDIKMIDEYYKTSDVVGIGGLVGTQGNKGFVKGIMKVVGNRKVHWLGFTNKEFVKHYKPYMCDSSSWEGGARYGTFSLYIGGGNFFQCSKKDFSKKPDNKIINVLKSYGVSVTDLSKEENWRGGRSINRTLNARSIVRYNIELEKNVSTLQFAAAATTQAVILLLEGFTKELK